MEAFLTASEGKLGENRRATLRATQIGGVDADGIFHAIRTDENGNLLGGLTLAELIANQPLQIVEARNVLAVLSPDVFTNFGLDAKKNIKTTAGNVFSFTCNFDAASLSVVRFLQLFNSLDVPEAAEVPLLSFRVAKSSQTVIGTDFFTNAGCHFSAGIAFGWSSTRDSYTAAAANEHNTTVLYK